MAMAEGLTGPADDVRGFAWGDQPAGAMLFRGGNGTTPNSPLPDVVYPVTYWCPDQMSRGGPASLEMVILATTIPLPPGACTPAEFRCSWPTGLSSLSAIW